MLSGEIVRRGIAADVRATFRGSAGQSFGAWLTSGVELTVLGRRQRLRRQGALGRRDRGPARPGVARGRRRGRDRRQHDAVRRDQRQGVLPRLGRRALRGPQLGRRRGRRGRRRPLLRVHDRRPRRRARADRAQLRGGHERRDRVRARRRRRLRLALQPDAGRARRAGRRRPPARLRAAARAPRADRLAGGRVASCRTSTARRWSRSSRTTTGARWSVGTSWRRPPDGRSTRVPRGLSGSRRRSAIRARAPPTITRSSARCPRTGCASRGGAAWTAGSRSATRAARSAT